MHNKLFNPLKIQPIWDGERISQYINGKFDILEKDDSSNLENAFLEAFSSIMEKFEFMLVVDGQLANLRKEREIVIKLATLHAIFFVFEKKIGSGVDFVDACKFAGSLVGREYAKTIINILIDDDVLIDYQGFLDLWCRFDTRAAWGRFTNPSFSSTGRTVSVVIQNSISALDEPPAALETINQFIAGYVYGVVDEGFRVLDFLFRQCKAFRLPNPPFSVNSVETDFKHPDMYVNLSLEEPTFRDAYDEFFKYYYSKNRDDLPTLRRSIEFALKEIFDIEKSSYYSTQRLLKALIRENIDHIDFQSAQNLYQKFSDFTHRGNLDAKVSIENLFFETRYFLAELAFYRLSKNSIKRLKRSIMIEEPSPNAIQKLEQEVRKDVDNMTESELQSDDYSKEIKRYERSIQKLETIITYYENHLYDILEIEAKSGGDIYLEPRQRSLKQEYENKIKKFTEERNLVEQKIKKLEAEISNVRK